MTKVKRICIVCDKRLESSKWGSLKDNLEIPPLDGIYLESAGNYGSSEYDPMDGSRCETYICDPCFKKKKDRFHFFKPKKKIGRK